MPKSSSLQRKSRSHRQQAQRRSFFEALEDRSMMALFTWTGATNNNWNTATNWTVVGGSGADLGTAGIPDAGDDAQFINNVTNLTPTLAGPITLGTLTLGGAVTGYNITGSTLTVNTGVSVTSTGATNTLSSNIAGAGGITFTPDSATDTLNINGANTYTGLTTLNRGITILGNSSALGATGAASKTIVNGNDGTTSTILRVTTGTALTIGEDLDLAASATGRVTLNTNSTANHTFTGAINISSTGNLVQIPSDGSGSMTITGDITGTMSGGSLLFLRGGSTSANNRIQGSMNITGGNLAKTDAGLWVVGAATKTYTWNTTQVAVGTLRMNLANILPASGTIIIGQNDNSGVTLDLAGFSQTTAGITFNRNTTTTGVATISTGAGTLTLNGNLTYNATTATVAGVISGNLNLGGAARTFTIADASSTVDLNLSNINISNGTLNKAGLGLLNFTGAAANSLNLTQVNVNAGTFQHAGGGASYTVGGGTGKTNVASGAAFSSGTGALINSDLDIAAGGTATFTVTTSPSVGSLSGAGNLVLSGNPAPFTMGANNLSTTFSGVISGANASVTKTGTGTTILSGNNTYGGATNINNGILQVGDAGTSGTLGAGTVTINSANPDALTINRSDTFTMPQNITGTGALTQAGSGTTILTGTNSYGATTINGGAIQLGNGGTTGSLGTGTNTNNSALLFNRSNMPAGNTIVGAGLTTLASTDTLVSTITGSTPDLLNLGGNLTIDGNLIVNLSGYTGVTTDVFTIIQAGAISGTFDSLPNGATLFSGGRQFTINYTATTVTLTDAGAAATPTEVYVDDAWIGLTNGDAIPDVNPTTAIAEPGTFGLNAFSFYAAAAAAVDVGGTVFVNAGTYPEIVNITGNPATVTLLGVDTVINPGTVTFDSLAGDAGKTINLNGNTLAFGGNNASTTIASTITGPASSNLNKVGTGVVTLSGSNTNAGTVNLNGGQLTAGNNNAFGTAAVNLNTGAVRLNVGGFTLPAANTITINGGVNPTAGNGAINGPGTITGPVIVNANVAAGGHIHGQGGLTFNGAINVSGATLSHRAGTVTYNAAITSPNGLLITGTANIGGVNFLPNAPITVGASGTGTLNLNNNNQAITSLTLGGGGLGTVSTGTGTLTMAGNLTSSGNFTHVINGNLNLGGATRTLDVADGTANPDLTINAVISNGGLTKINNGLLRLGGTAANTYVGTTTINAGTIQLLKTAGVNAIAGNVTIGDATGGDLLLLGASNQIADTSVLSFTSGGSGNSAFFRMNGFSETVGGVQTTTAVGAGQLPVIENTNATTASTLTINTANVGDAFAYDGLIRNGAAGLLAITKTGLGKQTFHKTSTAANNIDYTGVTTITSGTLEIGNVPAFSSNITNNGALSLNQTTVNLATAVAITGTGTVTKIGTGTATLTGASTMGATTVSNGTLILNNAGVSATSVAIGAATLQITGGTFTAGTVTNAAGTGNLQVNNGIMNVTSGLAADVVRVGFANGATVNGTLNVNGGAVTLGLAANNLDIGTSTLAASPGNSVGHLNLAGASSVTINSNILNLGVQAGTTGTGATARGTLTLPSSAAAANSITANTILMGDSPGYGNSSVTSVINLGGGTTNLIFDQFTVGGRKSNGDVNIAAGGNVVMSDNPGGTTATIDLSRRTVDTGENTLGRFNFGPANSVNINVTLMRQGLATAGSGAGDSQGDIEFSNAGTNTISINTWQVGESPSPGNTDVTSEINFGAGTSNVSVDTWDIGRSKSHGSVTIDAGGTLTVVGKSGALADLRIGENVQNTGVNNTSVFNMSGGTFNANLDELTVARHNEGAGSSDGTLTWEAGTVNANSVVIADTDRTGAGSVNDANTDGIINLNGTAVLNVAGPITSEGGDATLNFNNGILRFALLQKNTATGSFTFNWTGGTIENVAGQNLSINNMTLNLLTAGTHVFNVDAGQTATIQATTTLSGAGAITKNDAGTLTFATGATTTYTGTTTIDAGTLLVNNTLPDNAGNNPDVIVNNGGTLGGTGTVAGQVSVNAGGSIAPGTSPGILNVGNTTFVAGSNFNVEIEGTTLGTQYDQLNVTGTIDLGGSTLNLTGLLTPTPAALQQFVIINNDGTDAVTGTFAGLPQFATVTFNAQTLYISYTGGDGNDVVLSSQPVVVGTSGPDTLVLRRILGGPTDSDIEYSLNGGGFVAIPAANAFNFQGLDGNDFMTVDLINGDAIPANGASMFGNNPTTGPGDALAVNGRGLGNDAVYTPSATVPGAGTITLSGTSSGVISFTGLEPVDISGMGTATFQSAATTTIATVNTGFDFATGLVPALRVSGTTNAVAFETAAFFNNGTFVIDTATLGGAGVDTVTVTAANNAHANNNITLNLGGGTDRVNLDGSINTDGNLIFTATEQVVVRASLTIDTEQGDNNNAGNVDLTGTTISADAAGRDLFINTNVGAGIFNSGNVTLNVLSNAAPGTAFINDLVINTNSAGGLDGVLNLLGNISLNESGADLGDFTFTGGGDVAIGASLTVDTEDGNNANPGVVNWGTSNVYAVGTGRTLTINTNRTGTGTTGGNVNFGLVDDNAGANDFLAGLTVTTQAAISGELQLGGDVFVDGPISLARRVVAMQSLTIDSKQSLLGPGNAVNLGNSTFYARGGNDRDILIDTSTPAAGAAGGNVTFGDAGFGAALNPGANIPNDLTVNTSAGLGGTAGTITITAASFNLNDNGAADPANLLFIGGGNVVLNVSAIIDTESGNDGPGGSVDFGTSAISGNAVGRNLTIDTSTTSATVGHNGGDVTLAAINTATLLNNLSVIATANAANTAGNIIFTSPVNVAGAISASGNDITTNAPATLTSVGNLSLTARNAVTLNASVNTGAGTVSILANQDGAGAQGFSQAAGTSITTTAAATAVNIVVGGTGNATIEQISALNETVTISAGGSIVDNNAAANNISAISLVASAATGIDLDTTVTNITATNSGAGNVTIDETDGANVLNVAAANGTATVTSATGDLNVTTVSASTTATLTATLGAITDANGTSNNITAADLLATAVTGIDLDTTVTNITATNSGAGNVNIDELDGANVLNVAATNGSASVTSATGNLNVTTVSASTTATLTATAGAITDANVGGNNITAATLIATAANGIDLDTQVVDADLNSTLAGDVFIDDANVDLNLLNLNVANGNALITATGNLTDATNAVTNVSGNASFSAATITLGEGGGDAFDVGTLNFTSAGAVVISENSATDLNGTNTAASLTLTSAGALTDTATASTTVSGLATLSAAGITLGENGANDTVNFGTLTFTSTGAVAISEDSAMTLVAASSSTSAITLNTVDDFTMGAGVSLSAANGNNINVFIDTDNVGGGTVTIDPAAVITTDATNYTQFTGGTQADTFLFNPQATTAFRVQGNDPTTVPGDVLEMNVTGLNATLSLPGTVFTDSNSGDWTFPVLANRRSVFYGSIEDLNTTGLYGIGINNNAPSTQYTNLRIQLDTNVTPQLQIFADANPTPIYQDVLANVLSVLITGNDNNVPETVTIDDVNNLPTFASSPAAPAVNNNLVAGAPNIIFAGGQGTNVLVFDLDQANTNQIQGLGDGAIGNDGDGETLTMNGSRQLSVYGTSLAFTSRTGSGVGSLTVLAEPGADVVSIDAAGTATSITATGRPSVQFSGNNVNNLAVFGMGGGDMIDLINLGPNQTASLPITLDGDTADTLGTATNGDASIDTLRVRATGPSTNTGSVTLRGGDGNDLFQIYDASLTTDFIYGQVIVEGENGTDDLQLDNSGSATADSATRIDEDSITNYTVRNGADDVTYNSIESLSVATSSQADSVTVNFTTNATTGTNVTTATINASAGDDQILLTAASDPQLQRLNLLGNSGSDTFGNSFASTLPKVAPSTTTTIVVSGDTNTGLPSSTTAPMNPAGPSTGDVFNLDLSAFNAATNGELIDTGSGQVLSIPTLPALPAHVPLYFNAIEDINVCDDNKLTNVTIGDLYLRSTAANENIVFYRGTGALNVLGKINNRPLSTTPFRPTGSIVVYGRGGNDYIEVNFTIGTQVRAELYGEAGNDLLYGATRNDLLVGGSGDDQLQGLDGNDTMWGDDIPTTWAERQTTSALTGPAGNDQLWGGNGNDFLFGQAGVDALYGDAGDDYSHGGDDNDLITESAGNNILRGEGGHDQLFGATGNDILLGGAGNDTLMAAASRDIMIGGNDLDNIMDTNDASDDIMISGSSSLESDAAPVGPVTDFAAWSPNDTTLSNVLTGWLAGTSVTVRVAAFPVGLKPTVNDGVRDIVRGLKKNSNYFHVNAGDNFAGKSLTDVVDVL